MSSPPKDHRRDDSLIGSPGSSERPVPFVLLLAAGASRRFGSPKALALLHGEPMLARALRMVRIFAGDRYRVVLGHHHAAILKVVPIDLAHRVIVPQSDTTGADGLSRPTGLSDSLRAGISALPKDAEAALVMLADQPALAPDDLHRLVRAWRSAPTRAAAALHAGHPGAPCILPQTLFEDVLRLTGDRGAQSLLRQQSQLTTVDLPSAAIDIDTPEDLARFDVSARPVK